MDKLQFLVLITLLSIIITDIGGIGVACYGALGHVPPRLPTIYFFHSLWIYTEYVGNLSCQTGAYLQDFAYHSY